MSGNKSLYSLMRMISAAKDHDRRGALIFGGVRRFRQKTAQNAGQKLTRVDQIAARNAREIDDAKAFRGTGSRVDLALAFLIVLLAGALLFYLGSTLSVKA